MLNCGIYCITNLINKKRYIGQSINLETDRLPMYRRGKANNDHLQSAFNKYGIDNFRIEALINCEAEELDHYEIELIKAFNTMDPKIGYNKCSGGNKNKQFSEETKKKMSEIAKVRTYSEDTRKKMSEAKKDKKLTEDHRNKLSESHQTLEVKLKQSKPMIAFDGDKVIFLISNKDAIKKGFIHANCVCNGIRKHCKGLFFKFATSEQIEQYKGL